jgi:anti-sigma factor RsiW
MTFCSNRDDELADLAAGGTAGEECASHLRACAECAAELQRRRDLVARIDGIARAYVKGPVPDLAGRAEAIAAAARRRTWARSWRSVAGMAAAGVVAFALYAALSHRDSSTLSVTAWRSPTADLLRPTISVLDFRTGDQHAF